MATDVKNVKKASSQKGKGKVNRKDAANRAIESTLLLPEWSSCSCNNLCNRREKRGACPCLAKGSFCSHLCNCGTKKMVCTNRAGNVGSVLSSELGISRAVETDSSDESDRTHDEVFLRHSH